MGVCFCREGTSVDGGSIRVSEYGERWVFLYVRLGIMG